MRRRRLLVALASAPWATRALAANPMRSSWPRGRATPAVELPASDGSTWRLASARGRPLLLNFWASWCEPCRDEMPSLESLAKAHEQDGLLVMAVNFRESDAAVRRFVDATSLRLPVLLDRDGAVAKAFDVHAFPSTVIVDRRGRVSSIVMGECDWMSPTARAWVRAAS